jgi:carboxyl-terminal processing protease
VKGRGIISNIPGIVIAIAQAPAQMPKSLQFSPRFIHALLFQVALLLPLPAFALAQDQPLGYDRLQSLTTLDIIERLGRHHYARMPVDDSLSGRLLDNYLENLDSSRSVFLKPDIAEFERLRTGLDDALLSGDLDAGFLIYKRYRGRLETRLSEIDARLPQLLKTMDFSKDEVMVIDRSKLDWPADQAAADAVWNQQLKASVLSLKLAGKTLPEIEKLLAKRYKDQLRRVRQVNSEDVYQLYMNSFTELFDPHTNYLSPRSSENFNMNMRLSLEGIGAVLQADEEFTQVARLVPAGPAAKQGQLRTSDRIVAVAQGDAESVDVVGWRLDDVVDLIRGPKGSTVRLEVLRGSGAAEQRLSVSIVREQVKLEEQAAKSEILELDIGGTRHKIGVIDVPAFYADFEAMQRGDPDFRSTTRDVARLLSGLQEKGVAGVIIDLRDNGGGSLEEANQLTGLFIESGPTVQIRHSDSRVERKQKFRDDYYYAGPLLVLINRLSASASEIFAGAIQDYGRGLIVGTQSFGKGTVQSLGELNHGQLKLTESKFYRISGESTQHRGVVPDIEFPSLYDTDEVGESALHHALPWDRIAPVRHRVYQDYEANLGTLRSLHESRVSKDPEFIHLEGEIAVARKRSSANTVSLSEKVRIDERRKQREEELALENALRAAKGEPLLASIDELDGKDADAENPDDATEEAEPEHTDPSKDALLSESGRILLDAIGLGRRVAATQD